MIFDILQEFTIVELNDDNNDDELEGKTKTKEIVINSTVLLFYKLISFTINMAGQLQIFWHNGDSLGMNGT
jgi:hypothetical protein